MFFDLDGTITRRDTLVPYVFGWLIRRPWRLASLLCVLPALAKFVFAVRDHGALKAALIRCTLGGSTRAQIDRWNALYLPKLQRRGLFDAALAQIAAHRLEGDRLILMSASVDFYVPEIGRALGFDQTICTAVRWDGEQLDGALAGVNCRGEAKLKQLQLVRQRNPGCEIFAYGNSSPDLPHLLAADHGVLVNGSRNLRELAARSRLECVHWR